ncbi:uncharacterized protein LOC117919862 [Vitis riparia]|uniref:uncharacterized protein LOC117919862 n=1 Tax=Vitis riparia TaxID=96939 RepID=UPI00155A5241|nr:uncharacterized protein LOC117919862 [Vitis riparia]
MLGPTEAFRSSELGVGPGGLDPVSSSKARLYPLGASSLEGSRRLKAVETIGAPGPAGRDDCRGPPQSLVGCSGMALPLVWAGPNHLRDPDAEGFPFWEKDGRWKQVEEELYSMEKSRTYNALIEEASRYGCAPIPSGLLTFGSLPSPSFFFGRTPLGEYCDLSGDDRVTHLREIPLRMLLTPGPLEEENASRWELMEVFNGCKDNCGKELYSMEKSRTYNALIEEASRYECAPIPSGLLTSGSSPSPSFFFGRTPLGEYCDLSGDDRVTHLREIPLRMLLTPGPLEEDNASRWELMEVFNGCKDNCGKELCLVHSMPRERKGWEEESWEESELAKFRKFLEFSIEGLEKEILDFLVKIRKRKERVHNKNLLEKSKFERELKRLECSINYEGRKK